MAVYFVVFDEEGAGERLEVGTEFEGAKTLDFPKVARVLKVEASTIAAAQQLIGRVAPGDVTSTPVCVAESAWKTS